MAHQKNAKRATARIYFGLSQSSTLLYNSSSEKKINSEAIFGGLPRSRNWTNIHFCGASPIFTTGLDRCFWLFIMTLTIKKGRNNSPFFVETELKIKSKLSTD